MPSGASFFEDVPLEEFMYLVFTRMQSKELLQVIQLSVVVSLVSVSVKHTYSICLLILCKHSWPHFASDYQYVHSE